MATPRPAGLFALVLALALCVTTAAQPPRGRVTAADSAAPEPKLTTLAVVISQLKREATKTWREREHWPRGIANFAQDKNWALPETDVVRGLTRRLHDEPAIDAYVKWQLLSFVDELPAEDAAPIDKISAHAPQPLAQPVVREEWFATSGPGRAYFVSGTQTSYVRGYRAVVADGAVGLVPQIGVISSGAVLDAEGSTKTYRSIISQVNRKLEAERQKIELANRPILAYREALIRLVPDDGARLAMAVQDVRDRLNAGDPGAEDAMLRLVQQTERLPSSLPARVRGKLARSVGELGKLRKPVVESIYLDDRGKIAANHHIVCVLPGDVETIIHRLQPNATTLTGPND